MSSPVIPLRPAPRPKSESKFRVFEYQARGNVRYAYQILINLAMADFVVSIVYIQSIDHCKVILQIPAEHIEWVTRVLGISN